MSATAQRIPDLGQNPLEAAFENYQAMEHQLEMARSELAEKSGMVTDLLRENEFLRRNYDKAVAERDRYQALAVNLATRAVGVREAVERLLVEAVAAKAAPVVAPAEVGSLTAEMDHLLRAEPIRVVGDDLDAGAAAVNWVVEPDPGMIKRDITRRTTIAPNEFR